MIAWNKINVQDGGLLGNKTDNRKVSDKHRSRKTLAQNK